MFRLKMCGLKIGLSLTVCRIGIVLYELFYTMWKYPQLISATIVQIVSLIVLFMVMRTRTRFIKVYTVWRSPTKPVYLYIRFSLSWLTFCQGATYTGFDISWWCVRACVRERKREWKVCLFVFCYCLYIALLMSIVDINIWRFTDTTRSKE